MKMSGMFSLRRRRLMGDMIEVFKIIYVIDKGNVFVQMRMEEQEKKVYVQK